MLSVLIPTYNHECVLLADEISAQIDAAGLDAEVVVLDDGSTDMKSLADNSVIEQIDHCRYVVLPTNIGIARSRNRLMDEAKGDKLLFLDSDIWPKSDDFIVRYLEASDKADVVVGGIDYRRGNEAVANPLRLMYGLRREVRTLKQRLKKPYDAFNSSSFLIDRSVVSKVRFDETFDRYGHEDTFYGTAIRNAGISIHHIDNCVFHDNTDTADQYLSTVRIAIQSLSMHADQLRGSSRLLWAYEKLKALHLCKPISGFFRLFRAHMDRNLTGKHPSMFVLLTYKLSYMCGVMSL